MTTHPPIHVSVRRIHRRDLNRTWEFLKLVFREVNKETVEYQRPRTKRRFLETYEEEGVEQLLFSVGQDIVGYAECTFAVKGADNWMNPRYFDKKGMRPLFVEELAVHPTYQGRGVGSYIMEQLHHLAHLRGCTHLLLEVAENNAAALSWYRKRNFYKLDAAIFLAQKIPAEPDLLPPRPLPAPRAAGGPSLRHTKTAKTDLVGSDLSAAAPGAPKKKAPTKKAPTKKAPAKKAPAKKAPNLEAPDANLATDATKKSKPSPATTPEPSKASKAVTAASKNKAPRPPR